MPPIVPEGQGDKKQPVQLGPIVKQGNQVSMSVTQGGPKAPQFRSRPVEGPTHTVKEEQPLPEDTSKIKSRRVSQEPISATSAVSAFAKRGTGAAIQTGTTLSGAYMGGQLGALAGPWGVPIGVILGGISGWMAGDTIAERAEQHTGLVTSSIEDEPEELRPFAAAGEVIGGSIPFAGAPLIAASRGYRLPASWAGNYINKILEHAGRNPAAFASVELSASGSAALAGGYAEALYPGRNWIRGGAEMAGGILNPARLSAGIIQRSGTGIRDTILRMTPAGRQSRAGELLREALEAAGEDPDTMLKIIRETNIPGVMTPDMTAAQVTKSRALIGFEADLKTIDPKFLTKTEYMAQDAMESTSRAIRLLEGTGDQQALRQAAALRSEQYRLLMQTRLNVAERQVQEIADKIETDSPAARAELSRRAKDILDNTLERTRAIERELWNQIPKNTPLGRRGANVTLTRYSQIRGEMLADDKLPALLEKTITRLRNARRTVTAFERGRAVDTKELRKAQEQLSLGNMIKVRREFLNHAREAETQGKYNEARQYGQLAQAVLDDLSAADLGGAGSAYDAARRFSRELNDVFTRTFVGKTDELSRQGMSNMPPEIVLRRALATGEEIGALQMRQIEEATRFLADRGYGTALDAQSVTTMLDAQERVLRLAAAQNVIRDPATQEVVGINTKGLRKFINKNTEIFDRFPETKQLLEEAITSEEGRKRVQGQITGLTKYMENKSIFADVANIESPADAVRGALRGKSPVASLRILSSTAKQSGEDAVAGLRIAIFEDVFRSADAGGGKLTYPHLVSAIDDPIRPGLPSVRDVMRNEGLITDSEHALLGKLVERIKNIQTAQAGRPAGSPPLEETDTIIDTIFRVIGSRIGSVFAGGQTGPQLIASARGSAAFRRMFGRVPALKVQQLLIDAVSGAPITPGAKRFSLLEALLEAPPTPAEAERRVRQIHAYGIQAGYLIAGGYDIEGERQ